jgi:hypothetical protein
MGEALLVFTGLWFGIYFGLPCRKVQDCVMEEEKI